MTGAMPVATREVAMTTTDPTNQPAGDPQATNSTAEPQANQPAEPPQPSREPLGEAGK